ncbi:MAG: hypothetical protein E7439_02260 [Ruminococcaceae bacterium]|nr:hypothetical protein [Oscillospiraceae bacterium]
MNLKICPLMGKECQYVDCMMFNRTASQCSISVIAVELQETSANTGNLADTLAEISGELSNITTAVKGLV